MSESSPLKEFKNSLQSAKALMEIERQYSNPPKQKEVLAVQGLRGGAIVLMVASFENFIKRTVAYHLSALDPLKIAFHKLPDKIRLHNVFMSLEYAMKGKPYQENKDRIDRLADIDLACRRVFSGIIDPEVFTSTGGNPNPKTIKMILKNIGIDDIFRRITPKFEAKWKKPEANTFIEDKLDEIVNRRHVVAHTADALNISRTDLRQAAKFLALLAELIDSEIQQHVKSLVKSCIE